MSHDRIGVSTKKREAYTGDVHATIDMPSFFSHMFILCFFFFVFLFLPSFFFFAMDTRCTLVVGWQTIIIVKVLRTLFHLKGSIYFTQGMNEQPDGPSHCL